MFASIGLILGVLGLLLGVAGFCLWMRTDRQQSPALHITAITTALVAIALNLWVTS